MGSGAGRLISGQSERFRCLRYDWKRMGVDEHCVRSVRWIRTVPFLSGIFGGFLRRQTFRDEGRVTENIRAACSKIISQLVSSALSERLRGLSLRTINTLCLSQT